MAGRAFVPAAIEIVAGRDRARFGCVRQEDVDAVAAACNEIGPSGSNRIVPTRIERDGEARALRPLDQVRDFGERREFGDVKMARSRVGEGRIQRRRAGAAGAPRQEGALAVLHHDDGRLRTGFGRAFEPAEIDAAFRQRRRKRAGERVRADPGEQGRPRAERGEMGGRDEAAAAGHDRHRLGKTLLAEARQRIEPAKDDVAVEPADAEDEVAPGCS